MHKLHCGGGARKGKVRAAKAQAKEVKEKAAKERRVAAKAKVILCHDSCYGHLSCTKLSSSSAAFQSGSTSKNPLFHYDMAQRQILVQHSIVVVKLPFINLQNCDTNKAVLVVPVF